MNPRPIRAVRLTVLLLICCSVVAAQEATSKSVTVAIEVTDGHGSRIPKAQAEILSVATAGSKTLVTDDEGMAHLELEPGSYVVIVNCVAFKTVNRHITVGSAESQRFEFALQVGGCPISDPCPVISEQVPARTSGPASYTNSSTGLRQLLDNILLAARSEDQSELLSMIRETEIPNYQNWFTANFGQEKGESWAEPYGRWLAKNEKEFQVLLVKLTHMDGEFATEKLDSAKRYDLFDGPLDEYRASWKTLAAPKGEELVSIGDFFFVEGKFRWDSNTHYFPFQKPKTGSIVPAKLVKKVQPEYPAEALEKRIEGIVKLQVIVRTDGSVTVQNVVEGDPALSPAAIEAVRQWHYEPWQLNGKPIDMQTTIDVIFSLTK